MRLGRIQTFYRCASRESRVAQCNANMCGCEGKNKSASIQCSESGITEGRVGRVYCEWIAATRPIPASVVLSCSKQKDAHH